MRVSEESVRLGLMFNFGYSGLTISSTVKWVNGLTHILEAFGLEPLAFMTVETFSYTCFSAYVSNYDKADSDAFLSRSE